jgi:ureidoglycolate lyase
MRRVEAKPIDLTAFSRYGTLMDSASGKAEAINSGTTVRHSDLAALDLRGPDRDPVLSIYVAQARRFPLRLERLERHREAAQVFLPLGAHRFIVVVAPGVEEPAWEWIEAFITAPGQGVSLKRGCWHHGLIALGDGDRFAVIEGGNYRSDTFEVAAPEAIELFFRPA